MHSRELAHSIKFKSDLNGPSIPRIVFPPYPALSWNKKKGHILSQVLQTVSINAKNARRIKEQLQTQVCFNKVEPKAKSEPKGENEALVSGTKGLMKSRLFTNRLCKSLHPFTPQRITDSRRLEQNPRHLKSPPTKLSIRELPSRVSGKATWHDWSIERRYGSFSKNISNAGSNARGPQSVTNTLNQPAVAAGNPNYPIIHIHILKHLIIEYY